MRLLILCSLMALAAGAPARAHGLPTTFQVAGVLPKNSAEQFEQAFWNSV
jgi:hypothetical protein